MNDDEQPRIIIGEGERAGLPISAIIKPHDYSGGHVLRWRKNGSSFVLEQHTRQHGWTEIPFIEDPPTISGQESSK
jgi:hypothetical protein